MIEHLLQPLVCERFKNDASYRDGHLRVINALPERRVMGLHSPEMKFIAKQLSRCGCNVNVIQSDSTKRTCANGTEVIRHFETTPNEHLCYEETVIWGFLINLEKCTLQERLSMLKCYVPVLDNWAVCDSFCANAKWMSKSEKDILWSFILPFFQSAEEFEVRFAIVASMTYFLKEEWLIKVFAEIDRIDFDRITSKFKTQKGKPQKAQQGTVQGAEPYYVRMGVAWLLATALAKFPEQTKAFIHSSQLPEDIIRLYVRKARESFRTRTMAAL